VTEEWLLGSFEKGQEKRLLTSSQEKMKETAEGGIRKRSEAGWKQGPWKQEKEKGGIRGGIPGGVFLRGGTRESEHFIVIT